MRIFSQSMLLVAAFCLMGGHWATLQTAGWIGMVVSYSLEQKSVKSGLDATFSGEKPCGLCKLVSSGKEQEKDFPAVAFNLKKLEATLGVRICPSKRYPVAEQQYPSHADTMPGAIFPEPPAPVPIV